METGKPMQDGFVGNFNGPLTRGQKMTDQESNIIIREHYTLMLDVSKPSNVIHVACDVRFSGEFSGINDEMNAMTDTVAGRLNGIMMQWQIRYTYPRLWWRWRAAKKEMISMFVEETGRLQQQLRADGVEVTLFNQRIIFVDIWELHPSRKYPAYALGAKKGDIFMLYSAFRSMRISITAIIVTIILTVSTHAATIWATLMRLITIWFELFG